MPQKLTNKISRPEFIQLLQSKGLTIHGIPLVIDSRLIHLVKRERDRRDGLVIFEQWKKEATLFLSRDNYQSCFYCHPDMRGELESKVRRN